MSDDLISLYSKCEIMHDNDEICVDYSYMNQNTHRRKVSIYIMHE